MKQYESLSVTNINSGRVKLNEDQARRRVNNIKEVKDGIFEIVNPIQFKVGEIFGYNGELNRLLAQSVNNVDQKVDDVKKETVITTEQKAKKKSKKKAKKKSK